jgi:hypothetical protein
MAYNKGGVLASPATLLGLPQEYAVTPFSSSSPSMIQDLPVVFDRLDPMIMGDTKVTFKIFKADYLHSLTEDAQTLRACSSLSWVRIGQDDFCLALPCHKDTILLIKEPTGDLWKSWLHKKVKTEKGMYQSRKFIADHEILEPAFRGWDAWVWGKYGKRVSFLCLFIRRHRSCEMQNGENCQLVRVNRNIFRSYLKVINQEM